MQQTNTPADFCAFRASAAVMSGRSRHARQHRERRSYKTTNTRHCFILALAC